MRTSGLVLDIYDDFRGDVLRSIYPKQSEMPGHVKTAQALSSEDRERLPDDAFALVLVNGTETLRKFACIDEGNTELSVRFFLKTAHKLPEEAVKTAAVNLVTACGWYEMEIPKELAHLAYGEGWQNKLAEVSGTNLAPLQEPSSKKPAGAIVKAAGTGHLVPGHKKQHGDFGPEETEKYDGYTPGKNMEAMPQHKAMKPHVTVTDVEPRTTGVIRKEASMYALPEQKKYPLDNYEHVKQAEAYFTEFHTRLEEGDREEFAKNLVKRAEALGIPVRDETLLVAAGNVLDDETKLKIAFEGTSHWSEVIGNHYVNEDQLKGLALKGKKALTQVFDEDFVKEFKKDPKGIFSSLPRDQKILIMRMAADEMPEALST
jgi:hypothetical protein